MAERLSKTHRIEFLIAMGVKPKFAERAVNERGLTY